MAIEAADQEGADGENGQIGRDGLGVGKAGLSEPASWLLPAM